MVEFSNTQEIDNPTLPCQQGNLFLNCLPLDAPSVEFSVNGKSTGALPTGLTYKLENSLEGTTSRLTFTPDGGKEITLIEDLDQFNKGRPEDVGVFIGTIEDSPVSPPMPSHENREDRALRLLREYQFPQAITQADRIQNLQNLIRSGLGDNDTQTALDTAIRQVEDYAYAQGYIEQQGDEEDIYTIEIPEWLEPYLVEGDFDLETFSNEQLRPYAIAIANGLQLIDEKTGMQALYDATDGTLDFTIKGTNTVPLALDLIDKLGKRENRAFLWEAIKLGRSGRVGKVWRNSKGTIFLSFRGYAGLRQFLTGTTYALSNSKVSIISGAAKGAESWTGSLKSLGGKVPILSLIIITVIDVVEWLADDEPKISDLVGQLLVDYPKVAISTIIGTAVGAIAIAMGATVFTIVVMGIAAGVVVGWKLDDQDVKFGITQRVKDAVADMSTLEVLLRKKELDFTAANPEL
jgi:hypothetical protein